MIQIGQPAPLFTLAELDGNPLLLRRGEGPQLVVFFEADCAACRLTLPYLDRLARVSVSGPARVLAVSQDGPDAARALAQELGLSLPIAVDGNLEVSRSYDPPTVPALFLLDSDGTVLLTEYGFDKDILNRVAELFCRRLGRDPVTIAPPFDGAPQRKPGCSSRHLEPADLQQIDRTASAPVRTQATSVRAGRIVLADGVDPYSYCMESFGDPLPVVPPTVERVDEMLAAVPLDPLEVIGRIPPNYGVATVEKIAANGVMAGCLPDMLRVLLAVIRAACDERFNLHGVQATTHFAAPLVIVNGPIRNQLAFASGGNVFSNVARSNSTLGRAFQLVLTNIGGARPAGIDMSTLGNPGKFSYCIAENEEASPWEPFHVAMGFEPGCSTVTLFAAEPPRGVSEHKARDPRQILKALSRALATVWSYRTCGGIEALVIVCPEHARTLADGGFTRAEARQFLFENTGVPQSAYAGGVAEGNPPADGSAAVTIDGERCYLKFAQAEAIRLLVAGGTAGKFSAVIGSWAAGERGSQMVSYPIGDPLQDRSFK